ncbi:hypothetical protein F5050DRAFT_502381 [Lentinula boryana]|uniref:Uncharacterized protein n=1 Tax=Lentinula boryana TaxID=40481 RepID=A0ABQ8QP83_9AGAR|nr:hypothetical protein F5050DRAFT_502381 [Lentinula boryana]
MLVRPWARTIFHSDPKRICPQYMLRQKSDHKIRLFSSSPRVFKEDVDGTEMDKRTNHSSSSSTNNDVSARVIPRPAGASRVETKVIRTALGYDKEKWNVLLSCVRDNLAAAQLDWSTTWKAQKPEKLAEVFNAVEEHFPDTRRFADHWAVNRIAHQYWSQRKHQLRIMRNPTSSSKAKDDVPARNIPCLIPTYKVPMNHIRTTIGYDKKEWNRLRNCVRENVTVARLKWSLPWRFQKPEKLRQVYDAVCLRFSVIFSRVELTTSSPRSRTAFQKCVGLLNNGLPRQ